MIYYYDSLEAIERLRIELISQDYDYISSKLEQKKSLHNISDFDNWHTWSLNNIGVDNSIYDAGVYIQEQYIYALFRAKDTIDKINSGAPISSLLLTNILSAEYIPYSQFTDSWWVEMAETECPLFAIEGIGTEYDLRILFWIINGISAIYHLPIINKLIWELQLSQDSRHNAINHDCTLEYLLKYRELLQSNCVPVSIAQQQKQEQIYSISTNLTEEQLKRILKGLKTEGFVAPGQTEEDFLNSFEIEGRKPTNQGKINWIKESRRTKKESERIISKTVVFDFVNQVSRNLNDNKEAIEAIFVLKTNPIRLGKDDITTFLNPKRGKSKSEYHTILQNIIEG